MKFKRWLSCLLYVLSERLNPSKWEHHEIAFISTAHLTENDGRLISQKDAPCHLAEHDEGHASYFWITDDPEHFFQYEIPAWREFGFSESFIEIIRDLYEHKVSYVAFDNAANEVDGFPTFDW